MKNTATRLGTKNDPIIGNNNVTHVKVPGNISKKRYQKRERNFG